VDEASCEVMWCGRGPRRLQRSVGLPLNRCWSLRAAGDAL
jgi:hypothetical protein